jgi:hypothetical protein
MKRRDFIKGLAVAFGSASLGPSIGKAAANKMPQIDVQPISVLDYINEKISAMEDDLRDHLMSNILYGSGHNGI